MDIDLVGFYAPSCMSQLKAAGLHLHALDVSRQVGGHVLECELFAGSISWQILSVFNLELQRNKQF